MAAPPRRPLLILLAGLFVVASLATLAEAIYEDQVGLADWHQKYIGKVKKAVYHSQKSGRRRVVVLTEENVISSLDLRSGDIFWRHVIDKNDPLDQLSLSLGKYVLTLSSGGTILRAWNLPDGQMIWETNLQTSTASNPQLHVMSNNKVAKDNLVLVSAGRWIYAVSSIDGSISWEKEFSLDGLEIKQVLQSPENGIVYAVGIAGSSKLALYHLSAKTGEVLKDIQESLPGELSGEIVLGSDNVLVALNKARSSLFLIEFNSGRISYNKVHVSDLVQDLSETFKLQSLSNGVIALRTPSTVSLLELKDTDGLEVVQRFDQPAALSDALTIAEKDEAFAVVQHVGSQIEFIVKFTSDASGKIIREKVNIDQHRGNVEKVFLNSYIRTDKSHGFRALVVMEDHSLLLIQQGEVVWSREDGLASIVDVTTSELPVEKDGVSVADVEHNLFEWLKGHMLKLKGTLMLANADEVAAIQALRLKSSEKNKMTRDHNGFRKLLIVLTKAGKVIALHTGDGRIIWSNLLPSLRASRFGVMPSALRIYQWQVPHHSVMRENPSVLVVGKSGAESSAPGVFSILDSYSGEELNAMKLDHSVVQIIPLTLKDLSEQRLHLIVDSNSNAHLYPKSPDALDVFLHEMPNLYFYSVDILTNVIRGYSLQKSCDTEGDEYCFRTKELWSIIFPSDSERIAISETRKMNEVVHTQAKTIGDHDVMYKYLSKNIVFVATVSPKAAGDIGSALPEEASLVVYLIDAVTGRILHRVTHHGAQGPVHAVLSENWVVYHYFNLRAHRFEMAVIEIYDQSRADNKDVMKLILGKHNLSAPITSYARPEVVVKSQSYFFTHSVKAMAVTQTAKGITSKQLLIGTISDQVLALDKRYLDPRRSANPTQQEKEEGIIPLTDSLPIIPQSFVTHSHQVEALRGIVSIPAKLESTTLVFTYGVDLFYTQLAPSRTYDSLTDEFSYALLLITIAVLVAAIIVTWIWSEKKELRDKWR
ncbi:ER membrane protein complex subunit 1 [Panicum miliaceum]|uniref:ER membrane protein complex subunit 1 n=1 Tax=Panicum miliaceum TaxID=4540 RepID=A0A3L6T024_PANMI|nr:ER membrane protein complex subunit 1 [Panicum miliaceum]